MMRENSFLGGCSANASGSPKQMSHDLSRAGGTLLTSDVMKLLRCGRDKAGTEMEKFALLGLAKTNDHRCVRLRVTMRNTWAKPQEHEVSLLRRRR